MAEVLPLKALRYDLDAVGSLGDVVAPPYDVIDAATRAELLARSPYNAVAIDLPKPYGETGPQAEGDRDPYAEAAKSIEAWKKAGALVQDLEDTIWAMEQEYTGPDGSTHTRHGILARVRVEDFSAGQVLPHERTLPGPKQDRLELMRATRCNLSPIFSLSTRDPWPLRSRRDRDRRPWGEATDEGGTVDAGSGRSATRASTTPSTELLADAQLLIADGHHRYETAIAYRDEIGGEGDHNYTLMAITGLDDPGLSSSPPTACSPVSPSDPERQRRLGEGLRELFEVTEVETDRVDPLGEEGVGVFGLYDSHHKQAYRLRLKDTAEPGPPARGHARGLPPPRRRDPRDPRAEGHRRPERRRHPRQARHRLREERRGLAAPDRRGRLRRRLRPAPDPRRPDPRRSAKATPTCRRSRPTSTPRC